MSLKWKKSINKLLTIVIVFGLVLSSNTSSLVRARDGDDEQTEVDGESDNQGGQVIADSGMWVIDYYDGYFVSASNQVNLDLTTSIQIGYFGTANGAATCSIYDFETGELIETYPYTLGEDIVIPNSESRAYDIIINIIKMANQPYLGVDTVIVEINHEVVQPNISIQGNYGCINPAEIINTSDRDDASISWIIKDSDGETLLSGTGDVTSDQIAILKEGNYTIETTAVSETIYGNEISGVATDSFIIRHPQSTTTVDKAINPDSITGTKKIEESILTWEIKNTAGDVVKSGTGTSVPTTDIGGLENGSYTVEFTETSPENEVSVSEGSFIIRHPQSTTTVDKAINPDSITGTKKIEESTLTWEIKNADGVVIKSGTGNSVPTADIDALEEGSYTVEFTEISPENEVSISSGNFTIKTETPEPTPKTPDENTSLPETGDHIQIYVVMICLMNSLMMFVAILVSKRKLKL